MSIWPEKEIRRARQRAADRKIVHEIPGRAIVAQDLVGIQTADIQIAVWTEAQGDGSR